MRTSWITLVFAAILLTGCGDLPSLEGLANKENTVFDPALLGTWSTAESVIVVKAGDDQSYRIHWLDLDDDATPVLQMEARLVKLGEQRILDLSSSNPGAFAIPCHVFLRIRPVKEGLKVQFVDSLWIREKAKTTLTNFVWEKHPVLTAPSAQIATFLQKFGFDEQALDEPMLFRRLR